MRFEDESSALVHTWREWAIIAASNLSTEGLTNSVVFAAVLQYKACGERLLPNCYVRTSTFSAAGHRVSVGYFVGAGLSVNYRTCWDGGGTSNLGLAGVRIVP